MSKIVKKKGTEINKRPVRHLLLREVYRHYIDFEDFYKRTGQYVLEHKGYTISSLDLKYNLNKLSKRKKEAFFYNVILDKSQKEVGEIMNVTEVTVGQYVQMACLQLSIRYFAEMEEDIEDLLYNSEIVPDTISKNIKSKIRKLIILINHKNTSLEERKAAINSIEKLLKKYPQINKEKIMNTIIPSKWDT